MAYFRLGTMLYLVIQKSKEAMKISAFQPGIGGTEACMKIMKRGKKGCS